MSAGAERTSTGTADVADEALCYLRVVDGFAALDADPHALARTRAASARAREDRKSLQTEAATRKAVLRWRS
jgi:hypothetical protein